MTCELFKQISNIHVVALFPDRRISFKAWYRRLKKRLLNESNKVQNNREINWTLFFVTHFAALFTYACDHFSQAFKKLFDFIKALRKQNPIAKNLAKHISIFLKYIKSAKKLTKFAVLIITLSILLNNYFSNTHDKLLSLPNSLS